MTGVSDATSKRCEGDSWDITESVGATALSVAAARAVETGSDDPLIRDEFAYLLVSSAGRPWARLGRGIPADLADEAISTTLLRAELGATE